MRPFLCILFASFALASTSFAQSLWVTPAEIASRPTSGPAWSYMKAIADTGDVVLTLSDQNDNADITALACALVYARTADEAYAEKARQIILASLGTEDGGRTLALGRNLAPIVIAADLIRLQTTDDGTFELWLSVVRTEDLSGRTLISTHEDRPNNWGTMAGASRIAVALYLNDTADLERAWKVYKGYCGDRSSYAGFKFGDLIYQWNPDKPVGINPAGAFRNGIDLDGCPPDDARRGPIGESGYPWEGMQGLLVQAELLHRAGYPAYLVGGNLDGGPEPNMAVLRAYEWIHRVANDPASGDDRWQIPLVNARYSATFPVNGFQHGKLMGFTEWTHGGRVLSPVPDSDPIPAPLPDPLPIPIPDPLPIPIPDALPIPIPDPTPSLDPLPLPPPPEPIPDPTPLPPDPIPDPLPIPVPDPEPVDPVTSIDVRVVTGTDDAEQRKNGTVSVKDGDLQLINSSENTATGIRFVGLNIPRGAVIVCASLNFSANERDSGPCNLAIHAHAHGDAPTFRGRYDITSRQRTAESIQWSPGPWGIEGATEVTPCLATLVQEIVDRDDWSGNAIAFVITGTGQRVAESYEGRTTADAPVLHVEWFVP